MQKKGEIDIEKGTLDLSKFGEIAARKRMKKKIILIGIFFLTAIILAGLLYLGLKYFSKPKTSIEVGAEIESVLISENGKNAYIKLKAGINEGEIEKVHFYFIDDVGNEYFYETEEGIGNISIPYKKSFLDIFRKPEFLGIYNYEINSSEISLNDFSLIKKVSVSFVYKEKETGKEIETNPLDTQKPVNKTTSGTGVGGGSGGGGSSGGGTGGGGSVTPSSCTNDSGCTNLGVFCEGNQNYNCTLGSDGCYDRSNLAVCSDSQQCVNGTGCEDIVSCTNNSNCSYLNDVCGYGICNLTTNNCEVNFNSSTTRCRTSAGVCDSAEYCTGSFASCPSNSYNSSSTLCRASSGICDIAEFCSGTSASCSTNIFNSSSTLCRASVGECDITEFCTGGSASCPVNLFNASGIPCSSGSCNGLGGCVSGGAFCGNNIIEGSEICDATNLSGQTCITRGYDSGNLFCASDCLSYNESGCYNNLVVSGALIVNHNAVQSFINGEIPEYWIKKAKGDFHIAYGHTSHGQQIPE